MARPKSKTTLAKDTLMITGGLFNQKPSAIVAEMLPADELIFDFLQGISNDKSQNAVI